MEIILDGGWDHSPVTGVFTRERTQRFTHTELREEEHMKTEMELSGGYKTRGLQKLKEGRTDPLEHHRQHSPAGTSISDFWPPEL